MCEIIYISARVNEQYELINNDEPNSAFLFRRISDNEWCTYRPIANIHVYVHAVLMCVTRQIKASKYPFEYNLYKYLYIFFNFLSICLYYV